MMDSCQDLLEEYGRGPVILSRVLQEIPAGSLDLSADEGSWTIRQIVHHIVDGDALWNGFIKQALGGQGGYFPLSWYWEIPQDEWVRHWAYARREIEPSLALYCANREDIVSLLNLIPESWNNTLEISWPSGETQTLSVCDVVQMHVDHLQGHLEDVRYILQTHQKNNKT